MNIGNIDHMTAEVEVYQDLVGAVSVGQPVELLADAFPSPLTGTVSQVGLEVGRQTVLGEDPAASTDARVVEVTVSLDEPSSRLASRFTNLQVVARIKVRPAPSNYSSRCYLDASPLAGFSSPTIRLALPRR